MARKILNLFEKNLLANSRDFFFIQKIYLFTKNLFGYKKFHKKYIESEKNHKKKTQSVGKKEKKIIFPAVIKMTDRFQKNQSVEPRRFSNTGRYLMKKNFFFII